LPTDLRDRGAAVPRVDWRGVWAYLAIAFGLAWTAEGIVLARGVRFTSLTVGSTLVLAAVMWTPAIAAFIVRRFVTHEGFATAGLRLGPKRPYLLAWIGVPLLIAAVFGLTVLFGWGHFDPTLAALYARIDEMARGQPVPTLPPPAIFGAVIFAQSLTIGVLVASVFTFGEEFGWTGFLLVRLLPLGRWRAAVIYGAIWGLWHAPIIAGGFNYPGYPMVGVVMMCVLTTAFALTQTALRMRYNSVLLTSFFHASINNQGLGIMSMLVVGVSPVLGGVTGILGIAAFAGLGLWLLAGTPELSPAAEHGISDSGRIVDPPLPC